MVVLDIRDVWKSYRTGFWLKRVNGLSGVSLTVEGGEIFGLLGPNGAGKTTLFKIVSGLIRPTSGSGSLMGQPLGSPKSRLQVGYLPENPAVYDFLTGRKFLELMGRLVGLDHGTLKRRVPELLDKMGLLEKQDLAIRKYSKGMVQRLALAQAVVGDPPVVLLDEPMSGLDPVGRRLVRDFIAEMRGTGKTAIFSSHVLSDAEALCDRVGIILGGKLTDVGPVSSLVSGRTSAVEIVVDAPAFELPTDVPGDQVSVTTRGGQVVLNVTGDEAIADRLTQEIASRRLRLVSVQRHRERLEDYFVRRAAELHAQGIKGAISAS